MGAKTNKTGQNQAGQPRMDGGETTKATVQVISASAGQESDYESENNNDQLHINLLFSTQSDNE